MKRLYDNIIEHHLRSYRQMAFLSGPRQSGKTTLARAHAEAYLNWDNDAAKMDILSGQERVADRLGVNVVRKRPLVVAFDEIHKYRRWKQFLKGFFTPLETPLKPRFNAIKLPLYQLPTTSCFPIPKLLTSHFPFQPPKPPKPPIFLGQLLLPVFRIAKHLVEFSL